MYAGKINSPATTLDGAIGDSDSTISVVDGSLFPAAPNLAVIGNGANAETILYGGKSSNDLTSVTREFQGDKIAWSDGTVISRNFTAYDYDTQRTNLGTLNTDKYESGSSAALAGIVVDGNKNVTPGDGAMIHVDTSTITDNNTSGSGTAAKYTHIALEAPTLAATNSSVTTSDVATLYINNAATAGTNQTITRNWAVWVDAGNARFDGSIYSGTTEALNSSGLVTVANQSNITGVSTITSGTWEGTTVAVAQGGTGATSLTNLFILGTHTTGNYLATLANATNGGTTIANSGSETAAATVAMNMNDLAAGVMADGDSIAFIDADDNATKKEALADLLDTVAGTVGTTGLDRSGATLVVTDLHPVGVSGSANQLLTDDGDGTVTSEAQLSFDGDVLAITGTGTAKGNKDILTITNDVNAADMDATETSILFNQWYYDGASPAVADSGRISIGTEQDWTSTASTQDSYIAFETALNGTVSEKLRINSDGHIVPVGDDTYDIGTSGAQFKDGYFDGTLYADAIDFNGSAVTTTATLSTGISDTNVLVANAAIIDDDFLRVDGTSIEGRSASEVASDIGAATVGLSVAMAIAL
jgi:hypothetical protein